MGKARTLQDEKIKQLQSNAPETTVLDTDTKLAVQNIQTVNGKLNNFAAINGQRWTQPDQTTYQRLISGYTPPLVDNWTPNQVAQFNNLQKEKAQIEQGLRALDMKRNTHLKKAIPIAGN